ncbi:hypothetical protein C2E25_11320 [Geothermobacter hydrogeniphilus]|uniref:Uncharacterized protein n=1 Tax=Geothermobacter hydrogeniphilus TaxID=1969733 RepID=A0A2K2H8Q3_9BACT|nr:hypothetical protein [Geothermobacter hydrogeniphilus]PNU19685.1 hypothetical protein C2E25_11320 [Geothermobacter hydrogeniphilus]
MRRLERTTSISAKEFQIFLWLFQNPDLLHGLVYVLANLSFILPLTVKIPDGQFSQPVLKLLKRIVEEAPNLSNTSKQELDTYYTNFPRALDSNLEGIYEKCPVYSALGHKPKDPTPNSHSRYRVLLAQFLTCHLQRDRRHHRIGESTIEGACRAIRELSELQHLDSLLRLPAEPIPTKEYLHFLEGLSPDIKIPSFPKLLQFFRVSLEIKKPRERHLPKDDIPEGEDEIETTEPTEEFPPRAPSARGNKRRKNRINRFELEKSRQRAKGKRNAIIRRNARLPIDLNEISQNDLYVLLDSLLGKSEDSRLPTDTEIKALLLTILLTGNTLQETTNFIITRTRPLHVGRGQAFLYWDEEEKYWYLPSPGPTIMPPAVETLHQYCRTIKWIRLPLTLHTSETLSPYVEERLSGQDGPQQMFTLSPSQAKAACQQFLDTLKKTHDTEITLTNLSRYLAFQIERLPSSDRAQAQLALGEMTAPKAPEQDSSDDSEHEERTDIVLHYSSFTVASLQAKYLDAVRQIEAIWLSCDPPTNFKFHPTQEEQSTYLGTPFRLRREVVRDIIGKLKNRIEEDYQAYLEDPTTLPQFHRTFLTYSSSMINMAVAMRAVKDCALPWQRINAATSFAVICDKDGGSYSTSRRAWLPPFVMEQIQFLVEHVRLLYNELVPKSPTLIKAFGRHLPGDSTRHITLADNLNAHLLAPKDLRNEIFQITGYQVRGNWPRPYLRSNLLEAGCPVESVDALLGHAEAGQAPWSKSSAFNPSDYQRTMEDFLVTLMTEDGWTSVRGLGRD